MSPPKRLYRSDTDRMLLGICGGLGEYFNADPVLIRVVYILASVFSGILPGIVAYFGLVLIVPRRPKIGA